MPRLIVALPAYNEARGLPPLFREFERLFRRLPASADPIIVVVDDGSTDRTAPVVRLAAEKGVPVCLVQHPQNRGLGEAIKTGLRAALEEARDDGDVVVCMDADNTHPPATVVPMLEHIAEGADMVIASRYRRGSRQVGVPLFRRALSFGARIVFMLMLRIPGVRDYTCGFRAYRAGLVRRALEEYGNDLITRNGFACTDQLLVNMAALGHLRIEEVPFILRYDRKHGASKLHLGVTVMETLRLLWEARGRLRSRP